MIELEPLGAMRGQEEAALLLEQVLRPLGQPFHGVGDGERLLPKVAGEVGDALGNQIDPAVPALFVLPVDDVLHREHGFWIAAQSGGEALHLAQAPDRGQFLVGQLGSQPQLLGIGPDGPQPLPIARDDRNARLGEVGIEAGEPQQHVHRGDGLGHVVAGHVKELGSALAHRIVDRHDAAGVKAPQLVDGDRMSANAKAEEGHEIRSCGTNLPRILATHTDLATGLTAASAKQSCSRSSAIKNLAAVRSCECKYSRACLSVIP